LAANTVATVLAFGLGKKRREKGPSRGSVTAIIETMMRDGFNVGGDNGHMIFDYATATS
jgi:hypothetical protein